MAKRKISLTAKVILIVTAFLLVVDVATGFVLLKLSEKSTRDVLNRKMLELAQTAAKLVNGDEIKALTIADKDNNTEPYRKNYEILEAFKTSAVENNADLAYIYCLVRVSPDKIVFSIDPSDDPGEFLTEEPYYTDAMIAATYGTAGVDSEAYQDRWGLLYSAYAPIYDSNNEVAGVIGVDVWAKWYSVEITNSVIAVSIIAVITISAGVLISLLITLRLRKKLSSVTSDLVSLENDLQQLLQEIRRPVDFNPNDTNDNVGRDEISVIKHKIQIAQSEVKQYIEFSRQKAYMEPLTKLGNRLAYFDRVKALNAKISAKEELTFTVVIYDLNGLKDINDTYGHEFGDFALITSANFIQKIFGIENSYRIGGDEMVIILNDTSNDDVKRMMDEFDDQLAIFNENSHELNTDISLSSGVAYYEKDNDKEFLDVFRRADKEMYKNKDLFYEASGKRRKAKE